jgi:hypothetical protein
VPPADPAAAAARRPVPRWLVAAVLGGAALVALPCLWLGRGVPWSPFSDVVVQFATLKALGARALAAGHLALWNSSMNAGTPALANPQSNYLFPLDLVLAVFPVERAIGLTFLLNLVAGGLGAWTLARRLLQTRAAALFAALAYMLAWRTLAMVFAGWLPRMTMVALLPWLLLACGDLVRDPRRGRLLALAVVVALSLLQGDLQITYYAAIAATGWSVAALVSRPAGRRLRPALLLGGAVVLGVLLAAPAWLPAAEFARLSTRTTADYGFFLHQPPRLAELATLVDPQDAGLTRREFWEKNFYFGLPLLALLPLGLARGGRRAWALLGASVLGVILCFDTPLLRLAFRVVPGFAWFRQSPRLLLLVQLPVVLIAAMGLDAVAAWTRSRTWVFTVVAAAACAAVFLDSSARLGWRIPNTPLSALAPTTAVHSELAEVARHGGRTAVIGRRILPYGMAGWHGVDVINGYAGLTLRHWIEYFTILQHGTRAAMPREPVVWTDLEGLTRPDLLKALDVERIVSERPIPLDRAGFVRTARYDQVPTFVFYQGPRRTSVEMYADASPLGPAYFATRVEGVEGEDASLEALVASRSPLDARVFGLDRAAAIAPAGATAAMVDRGPDRFTYRTESAGEGFLILSQVWYPGWSLRIDGAPVRVYRTNHALLGAFVPAGRHRLDLVMTSPALRLGLLLCAAGLLACLAVGLGRRRTAPVTAACASAEPPQSA